MDRQIGVGVIGLGWMGRVHTSAYLRVLEAAGFLEAIRSGPRWRGPVAAPG